MTREENNQISLKIYEHTPEAGPSSYFAILYFPQIPLSHFPSPFFQTPSSSQTFKTSLLSPSFLFYWENNREQTHTTTAKSTTYPYASLSLLQMTVVPAKARPSCGALNLGPSTCSRTLFCSYPLPLLHLECLSKLLHNFRQSVNVMQLDPS